MPASHQCVISNVFQKALGQPGLIAADDTVLIFYDLDFPLKRLRAVTAAFPAQTLHTIAIKANPLPAVLQPLAAAGAGLEAASLPELQLALTMNCPPDRIVFDSPVKAIEELQFALAAGVHINADSCDELERIATLLDPANCTATIGLRINPQVGTGSITSTSVAGDYSKFGVPIRDARDSIYQAYLKYPWLTGIHLPIGSQGCDLALLRKGVETVYALAREIDQRLMNSGHGRRIVQFDIGGGLPVSYHRQNDPISFERYAKTLAACCPDLFTGRYRLITEFGRVIHAGSGWAVSRVEYVRECAGIQTAMIHLGADMFVRKCYCPDDWHHEFSVLDSSGREKPHVKTARYTIAGPLCFSGDIIGRDVELPCFDPGDYLVIHDTGAYTLSMWSRYNSRQMPKIIGYCGKDIQLRIVKPRERVSQVLEFWGSADSCA